MNTDAERIAAAQKADVDWKRPVIIQTDLLQAIGLIGMVQLALRHPDARKTPTGKMTREFITQLIEKIDPEHGEVWTLLNRGFNPRWDI